MCWWRVQHVWGTLAAKTSGEKREEEKEEAKTTRRNFISSLWQCLYFMYGFLNCSNSTVWLSSKQQSFSMHSIFEWICWIVPSPPHTPCRPVFPNVYVCGSPNLLFCSSTSHLYINELCSPTVRASVRRLDDDEEWDYPSLRFRSCHSSVSQSFVVVICHH